MNPSAIGQVSRPAEKRAYREPPVIEALCELRFRQGASLEPVTEDLFFERIKERFPRRRRVEPNPQEVERDARFARTQFLTSSGNVVIQLGPNLLIVNALRPYPRWGPFKEIVSWSLVQYTTVFDPAALEFVALRYINRINADAPFTLEDYITIAPRFPDALPEALSSWTQSAEAMYKGQGVMRLRAGTVGHSRESAGLLLDLEFEAVAPLAIGLGPTLQRWMDAAHDEIESLFEGCITERARALFHEESPANG